MYPLEKKQLKLSLEVILIGLIFISFESCHRPEEKEVNLVLADTLVNFQVRPATKWTNFFYRKNGWFGADGIFTMNLNGREHIGASEQDSVFMYFSDTMTGEVKGDTVESFKMINNSYAAISGFQPSNKTIQIKVNSDEVGRPINYFNPTTPNTQPEEYYWLGDGFVNHEDNNSINIFGYRVVDNGEKSWDFEIKGVTLLTIPSGSKAPFVDHSQIDLPLFVDIDSLGKGTFGAGIYVHTEAAGSPDPDGYLYVYGLIDPGKKLVVSRVPPKHVKEISKWRFWDGVDWNINIDKVQPVTDRVSNEVSLTRLKDNRFLLVFQEDGIGQYTAIRIGEHPVGPFGPIQRIWKAPEVDDLPGIIPYNAKAHPALSNDRELLISYNTITMDYFNDILNYPHSYRPRFIWLRIDD
ncbi:MAG: hypothetical protein ABJF04_04530 [Reichenbachiella sp.]|uniref:hypothetical protein n=1 Tax=Reichenbachiella sp. TaxID=2184521 RepID=UPI0032642039